jgi:hypothetical protein
MGTARVNYRVLIFPPWYVYHAMSGLGKDPGKSNLYHYFVILITLQWLLIFLSGTNFFVNLVSAHLSIIGLLFTNTYFQLNVGKYPLEDRHFLRSAPVRLSVALGSVTYMYSFAGLPKMILGGIEKSFNLDLTSNALVWQYYHHLIAYLLVLLWFLFVWIDKSQVFDSFPRSNEGIWPSTLNKLSKAGILLFNCAGVLFFRYLMKYGIFFFDLTPR